MTYVFLSYAKSDRDTAFAIRDLLEEAGLSVWLDENTKELSQKFWTQILERIRNAGVFITLVSDAAQHSARMKRELDFAEMISKPVFPLLMQGVAWADLRITTALKLDSKLELPNDWLLQLKEKLEKTPARPLPEQINLDPPNLPPALLWIGGIVALMILGITFVQLVNFSPRTFSAAETAEAARTRGAAVRGTSSAAMLTRTERSIEASQTRASRDSLRATQTAIFRATNQSILTAQNIERSASNATQTALIAVPTQTARANFSLTAVAANTYLPCGASASEINLKLYRSPSASTNFSIINLAANEDYRLIVVAWLANDDGFWLEVGTEALVTIGYLRPDTVLLDPDCLR